MTLSVQFSPLKLNQSYFRESSDEIEGGCEVVFSISLKEIEKYQNFMLSVTDSSLSLNSLKKRKTKKEHEEFTVFFDCDRTK